MPAGSWPDSTVQLYGGIPPLANRVVETTGPTVVSLNEAVDSAIGDVTAETIGSPYSFDTLPFGPLAATVYVALTLPLGIPESTPAALIVKPRPGLPVHVHGTPQPGAENVVE